MIYAMSDIHGCYEPYRELLRKIQLSEGDTLYVLGDVIDRGPEPIRVLQDMAARPNVIPLVGNHEYMALSVLKKLMLEITDQSIAAVLDQEFLRRYQYWMRDGGQVTLNQFQKLPREERECLVEYLEEFRLYEQVDCGGKRYVLVHADLAGADKTKDLEQYGAEDVLFTRADYGAVYDPSYYLVTGHTPTFAIDPKCAGSIYQKNHHIALDCGCVFGKRLGAVCLDTGECAYSAPFSADG